MHIVAISFAYSSLAIGTLYVVPKMGRLCTRNRLTTVIHTLDLFIVDTISLVNLLCVL